MAERPSLSGRFSTSRPTIWSVRESRLVGLSYIKPAVETSVSPPSLPRRAWSGPLRPASLDRSGQRLQSSKVSNSSAGGRPGSTLRDRLLPDPKLESVQSKVGRAGGKAPPAHLAPPEPHATPQDVVVRLSLSPFIPSYRFTTSPPAFDTVFSPPLSFPLQALPSPSSTMEYSSRSHTSTRRHPASLLPKFMHDARLLDLVRSPVTPDMISTSTFPRLSPSFPSTSR
jgi:hypothetical protein